MKTTKILTILVLALGLITQSAKVSQAAPMGTAFTYQGRLIDANNAADGLYDFQFKLYDAKVTGTQKGSTIDVNELDVIDGYFTVLLDFGSNVFDGNDRWLEIGVRPGELNDPNAYTLLSPRQKVTPTPYAFSSSEVTGRVRTVGIYEEDVPYWTARESNRPWASVAMSADGTKQTAVDYGGQIYVSTDSGNTWTPKESNRWWVSVAMSADGTKQTAVVFTGQIYVSTDSGNTWTPNESNREWWSVAMSADGTKQTAVVDGGRIYVSSAISVGIGTTSPTVMLDVAGDAKVSSKQVTVGEERLRIIRGTVLADGSIHAGSGFTIIKGDTGFYHINFSTAFSARPSVIATWKYPDSGDDFDSTGTTSNVYTICAIAVDTNRCKIKVQGTSGGAINRAFEFMAVGPR